MNLSDTSSIISIVLGVIACGAWIQKQFAKFSKELATAKSWEIESNRMAQQLLANATTPAKRADIHLYMLLELTMSSTRKIQTNLFRTGFALFLVIFVFFIAVATKFLVIDYAHPIVILLYFLLAALVVSISMHCWYSYTISKMEDGWTKGTMQALQQKISQHAPNI